MHRRTLLHIAQIAVTIVLLIVLMRSVQWQELQGLVGTVQWNFIYFSIVFIFISHLINIVRWRSIIPTHSRFNRILVYYGAGLFSNNFLPTGIGGDGVRVVLLSRDVPLKQAMLSVAVDRMLGLFSLSALLVPALYLGMPPGMKNITTSLIRAITDSKLVTIVLLGCAICAAVVLLAWKLPAIRPRLIAGNVDQLASLRGTRPSARHWFTVLTIGYVLGAVSQSGLVLGQWAVIRAAGVQVSFGAALWLLIIVSFSLILPLTVNGLGLQENLYVVVLGYYGVAPATALFIGLLVRMLMIGFSLLGGLLSLTWRGPLVHQEVNI